MTPELATLLQRAYPGGTIYSLDEEALKDEARDNRLRSVLDSVASGCGVRWEVDLFDKPAYRITLTQLDHPTFQSWIWSMDTAAKLNWIERNNAPYPVLWLNVSKVADFYYLFYNHWTPRGNTGFLDADYRAEPNESWKKNQETLEHTLALSGFAHCTDVMAAERTSLVKEQDFGSIPDDDPRWDEDGFEPPLVDSSIHECLFSH